MLKKRFSTALLALLVVTAMSGSAFAEDVASDQTSQINAPAAQTEPAVVSDETQTSEVTPTEVAASTTPAAVTEAVTPAEEEATPAAVVVEDSVTPPAIVAAPVAATLTITQRLTIDGQNMDMVQTFDGFEVGQTINLANYIVNDASVVCVSNPSEITVNEANNTAMIEYNPADATSNQSAAD